MDYNVLNFGSGSSVSLATGNNAAKISGINELIQITLIELLSDPQPTKARGAGLATLILNSNPADASQMPAKLSRAISTAKTHILANQSSSKTLSKNERLADLKLLSAKLDGTLWRLDIQITNQAGVTTSISPSL